MSKVWKIARLAAPTGAALAILIALPRAGVASLNDALAVVGFFSCVHFCLSYHYRTGGGWLRDSGGEYNEIGINLMLFAALIASLFGLRSLAIWLGDGFPGQIELRAVLFAATIATIVWRTQLMWRAQADDEGTPGL